MEVQPGSRGLDRWIRHPPASPPHVRGGGGGRAPRDDVLEQLLRGCETERERRLPPECEAPDARHGSSRYIVHTRGFRPPWGRCHRNPYLRLVGWRDWMDR